jgi:hypothetical protein
MIAHYILGWVRVTVVLWISTGFLILWPRGGLELWGERASLVEVVESLEGSWYLINLVDRLMVARVFILHVSNFLFQFPGLLLPLLLQVVVFYVKCSEFELVLGRDAHDLAIFYDVFGFRGGKAWQGISREVFRAAHADGAFRGGWIFCSRMFDVKAPSFSVAT